MDYGSLLDDWGVKKELVIEGDSSACKGTLNRIGSGRIKHLETRQLWMQQHIKQGTLKFIKIPREINSADLLTKHWGPSASKLFLQAEFHRPSEEEPWAARQAAAPRAPLHSLLRGGVEYIPLVLPATQRLRERRRRNMYSYFP